MEKNRKMLTKNEKLKLLKCFSIVAEALFTFKWLDEVSPSLSQGTLAKNSWPRYPTYTGRFRVLLSSVLFIVWISRDFRYQWD